MAVNLVFQGFQPFFNVFYDLKDIITSHCYWLKLKIFTDIKIAIIGGFK